MWYNHAMLSTHRTRRALCRALLAVALLLGSRLPGSARAQEMAAQPERPLLVRLPDGVAPEEAPAYLATLGLEALAPIPRIHVWRARPLPGEQGSLQALQQALAADVVWIEEDGLAQAQDLVPNDPYYATYQWNLPLVGLEQAWAWSTGSDVVVAIIDSGMHLTHPDLAARLWVNPGEIAGNGLDDDGNGYVDDVHGWDLVDDDAHPQDLHGHGTHVAGIAGAHTNNAVGVAGVAWGASHMALRVLDAAGDGAWSDVAEAIIYAADNGARVLNLSLGGSTFSQTLADAVVYAQSKGCLIVAAAGNRATPILFPAALAGVVAVGATTSSDGHLSSYSRGPQMDVAAPGIGIYSTRWLTPTISTYGTMSGTSMATPHVSGVAALLWAHQPALTPVQVTYVITSTAKDVYTAGWDEFTGWGRIDARAAMQRLTLSHLERRFYLPLYLTGPGQNQTGAQQ
jgi:thermitase